MFGGEASVLSWDTCPLGEGAGVESWNDSARVEGSPLLAGSGPASERELLSASSAQGVSIA